MKNRVLILLLSFIGILNTTVAQTTKVTGKVVDADSQEPLPFINVIFKGSKIGTTSDFDGNFAISGTGTIDSLVFTYIGYRKKTIKIKVGQSQNITVGMNMNTVDLKEVVIKPGENPAHVILRKLIKNKYRNDNDKLLAYEFESYNKIEFDINNLKPKTTDRKILKPFDFVFSNIDSTNKNEKPYLPMFMSESISNFYFKNSPKFKKEVVKASKIAGVKNKSITNVMSRMYEQVNIYDNNMIVFGKYFVSPISDNGLLYYKYYLIDSLYLGDLWCYHIQFKPKRKQELTFNGNMWISDTTFALKRIEMGIAEDANINFIKTFSVVQEYVEIDSTWMLSKDKMVIDFAPVEVKGTTGLYGRKTTSNRNFKINKPQAEDFYSKTDNMIVEEGADQKDKEFWQAARHDTLSKNEEMIYKMVDTIQKIPAFLMYKKIMETLYSGYFVKGKFEYGLIFSTYSFNQIEGNRFRTGGRTSNAFSKWIEFNGYTAYGTLDKEFKYGIGFRAMLSKKPTRQQIAANYKNDYEILGQSTNAFSQDNLLVALARRTPLNNLTKVEQYRTFYDKEWFQGYNTRVTLTHRVMTPLGGTVYRYFDDVQNLNYIQNIKSSEISINNRFAYDEKYVNGEFERISLGTRYPIFILNYTAGLKGVLGSNYSYNRLSFSCDDRIRVNPLGYFDYLIEVGKIFGTLPYPLLQMHAGNETYVYDYYSYNLMNYFEFASDQYASLTFTHHFDGLFLNHIPIMRKLKWREIAMGKTVVGSISNANREQLILPSTLYSLKDPYAEVGVGIENIFRVIRINAIWRLTQLDHPNITKFGVRVTLQYGF